MNNPLLKFNIKQITKYYEKLGSDLKEYKRINKFLTYEGIINGPDSIAVFVSYKMGLALLEQKFQVLDKEIYRRNHLIGVL